MKKTVLFIICLLVPITVGTISAYITRNNMVVFDNIQKPTLTPPGWVFPIAWSILYTLMGIALFIALINCKDKAHVIVVLIPYVIQLILNFWWSIIFFNYEMYGVAFICLVLMWAMIIRSIIVFSSVSLSAAAIMLPYLLWVTFAGYLNVSIYLINK